MSKSPQSRGSQNERRRAPRRPILDSFSLFVVIAKKGGHRLPVHDVSELVLGCNADIEGEGFCVPLSVGDTLEIHLYLNQTLHIPLVVRLARVEEILGVRRLGAEFTQPASPANEALNSFLRMLDSISEVARIAPPASKT